MPSPAAYVGTYRGPARSFEIAAGGPLTIIAGGQSAALQPWGGEVFRTVHPAFRNFSLMFTRMHGAAAAAAWGPEAFLRAGSSSSPSSPDPALAKLAGRFVNDDPWYPPTVLVERGGKLWFGTETALTRIGQNLWRVGEEVWSPERASFADFIDGRPQTLVYSGVKFSRHDI